MLDKARGVPSRLPHGTVRIAKAASDYNSDNKACLGRMPAEGPCPLGMVARRGSPGTFVLLGDSHAEMLRSGLDAAARAAGQRGYYIGKTGCVPMQEIVLHPMNVDCDAFNAATWSWLDQRRDIEVVLVALRWTLFVEGTGIGAEHGNTIGWRWIGPATRRPASTANAALMEAAVTAMVDRLVASGRRVVLIGPVPEPGYHVPIDTARRRLIGLAPRADVPVADFEARAGRTERLLQRIAARSPGAEYLPLSDLFCQHGSCRSRAADGLPLYFDDDHVTRTTAMTLLRPRLDRIWAASGR